MPDIFAKEHELLQALYQNTNLQHICNKIEELTGTPIGVGDFFWSKVAMSRGFPKDDLADMINRIEHLPVQQRERSMEKMFQWLQDRQPRLIELPYLRNCRMVCGVFYQNRLLAYLEAPDVGSSYDQLDVELFKACADIMGLALYLNHFPIVQAGHQPFTLLWNHFNNTVSEKYTEDWSHCPEFRTVDRFTMLWLESPSFDEALARELTHLAAPYWDLALPGGALCLWGTGGELAPPLARAARQQGLLVGASDSFASLDDLDEALRQAKAAVAFARRLGPDRGLAVYNNYKLQDLLGQAGRHLELGNFCSNTLFELRAWDAEHQTEYERTLKTYLLCGQSILATAQQMFIHKNTVIYRINKLKEQFGVDFGDCGQISHLYCSFLIGSSR